VAENTITNLTGQIREARGSQAAKHMRQDGRVPAVLYQANDDKTVTSVALDFAEKDIRNLVARRPTLIKVSWGSAEEDTRECVLREVQRHPVTQVPMHLDLLGVKRGVKMDSTVQLRLTGTPVGVKDQGGVLQQTLYEFAVRCLPKDLVHELVVDVTELNINEALHVSDIDSGDIEIVEDPERTIATVAIPRALIEETVEEEEGEEGEEGEGVEGEEGAESAGDAEGTEE
jgi:large subunit ribosomal protein L25